MASLIRDTLTYSKIVSVCSCAWFRIWPTRGEWTCVPDAKVSKLQTANQIPHLLFLVLANYISLCMWAKHVCARAVTASNRWCASYQCIWCSNPRRGPQPWRSRFLSLSCACIFPCTWLCICQFDSPFLCLRKCGFLSKTSTCTNTQKIKSLICDGRCQTICTYLAVNFFLSLRSPSKSSKALSPSESSEKTSASESHSTFDLACSAI